MISTNIKCFVGESCRCFGEKVIRRKFLGSRDRQFAGAWLWGACENYPTFVGEPVASEQARKDGSPNAASKLEVQAYFAESDMMIGEMGKLYFEECWSAAEAGGMVEFEAITTDDTNHDSICGAQRGVLEKIFDEARLSLAD